MIAVIVMMFCMILVAVGGYLFMNQPKEGDECDAKNPDDNALSYEIDADGKCVLKSCKSGYIKSGKECIVEEEEDDEPTEYVYEFIVKEQTVHTKDFNIHITDIRADGVRVTSDQLEMHEEPEWAKCNSKAGGYECEGENYGINDPEPATPAMNDLTWSAWKEGQAVTGTKLLTITMPSKVARFEMDFFRPKYVPGWTIKENGVEVLSTSKGANENTPTPSTVEYIIP